METRVQSGRQGAGGSEAGDPVDRAFAVVSETLGRWRRFLSTSTPVPQVQALRLRFVERGVMLPVKGVFLLLVYILLFFSRWFDDMTLPRNEALDLVKAFSLIYGALSLGGGAVVLGMDQVELVVVQRVVFAMALVDGIFLASLTIVSGGFGSLVYWIFLGLIVRNAVVIPEAVPQVVTNLLTCFWYLLAGLFEVSVGEAEADLVNSISQFGVTDVLVDDVTEPFLLRLMLLLLMTACCYGVQVLFDKQRMVEDEAQTFALRQEQLQATGRLAAEIAHQLKNPLGIINNSAFNLQRMLREPSTLAEKQMEIIREEVQRCDRIITELMGYAQLVEGRVERVDVCEELDRAVRQVFPEEAGYAVEIRREFLRPLPPLMVQRGHLNEVFSNLLQNAREAMNGQGNLVLQARGGADFSVVVVITDNGPGIAPENLAKIYEPYFTTKERGTGLGLAIVRHNVEIYGGRVEVESELGKGTRFTLAFPAGTMMKLRK